eukprot:Sro146_g067590.1 n/a (297) ;mRNA; f:64802-65692
MTNNSFHAQKEGIGFIACMDKWKMKNFDVNYCYQFMMALQGFMVPVKTQLFLIVNPPSWFGGIWTIMRPMLAPSFRKRVKIVPESKIHKYLAPGFEQFLPDDMKSGRANTDAMVEDFIAYRVCVERHLLRRLKQMKNNKGEGESTTDTMSMSMSHRDMMSISHSAYRQRNRDPQDHSRVRSSDNIRESPIMEDFDEFDDDEGLSTLFDDDREDDDDDLMSMSRSSGSGKLSFCSRDRINFDDDDDDDDASIHCDIEDDEMLAEEDMKQPPKRSPSGGSLALSEISVSVSSAASSSG